MIATLLALVAVGLVVASFFVKRHRESDRPRDGWRPTTEIFNDPSTNRVMRVWLDDAGQRQYVEESERFAT